MLHGQLLVQTFWPTFPWEAAPVTTGHSTELAGFCFPVPLEHWPVTTKWWEKAHWECLPEGQEANNPKLVGCHFGEAESSLNYHHKHRNHPWQRHQLPLQPLKTCPDKIPKWEIFPSLIVKLFHGLWWWNKIVIKKYIKFIFTLGWTTLDAIPSLH